MSSIGAPDAANTRMETLLRRALVSSPLLLISYGATKTLGATVEKMLPLLVKAAAKSLFEVGDGNVIQIPTHIYKVDSIDGLMKALVAFFLPFIAGTDPVARLQTIAFLSDFGLVLTIGLIESMRSGNRYTVASVPFVGYMLSQLKGAGMIMPIYFFLSYLTTSHEHNLVIDHSIAHVAYAKTLLPALAAAYVIPAAIMFFHPNIMVRQYANGIWQLFPIWLSLTHRLLSHTVKDTASGKPDLSPKAGLPYLRAAYLATGVTSASIYLYLWAKAPYSMKEIFFSGMANPAQAVSVIGPASARFMRWDYACLMGSGLYWTLLQFWDLKRATGTSTSWFKFLGAMAAGTVSVGPGAAMAGFWWWREELVAKGLKSKAQ